MIIESIEIKRVGAKYTFCIHTNIIDVGTILEFDTPEEALAAAQNELYTQQLKF